MIKLFIFDATPITNDEKNMVVESVNDIMGYITQSRIGNNKSMFLFLFLVIGIGLLSSLLVPTIVMTNVQAYSSGGDSTSSGVGIREMGPCNGDSNLSK